MYTATVILSITSVMFAVSTLYYQRKISLVVKPLEDIGTNLIGSAEQIKTVSRDLKNASEEQIDTLSATVSSSHEISAMINRAGDNTKHLSDEADRLGEMTQRGSSIVREMVQTSLEIKQGSEHFKIEMKNNLDELYDKLSIIRNISEKTKLINDIVFQTKTSLF